MWIFAYYKYICTHKQTDTFTHKRGLGVKPPLKNVREKIILTPPTSFSGKKQPNIPICEIYLSF